MWYDSFSNCLKTDFELIKCLSFVGHRFKSMLISGENPATKTLHPRSADLSVMQAMTASGQPGSRHIWRHLKWHLDSLDLTIFEFEFCKLGRQRKKLDASNIWSLATRDHFDLGASNNVCMATNTQILFSSVGYKILVRNRQHTYISEVFVDIPILFSHSLIDPLCLRGPKDHLNLDHAT